MEFEVRLVGGIDNCFVSLPLDLIQILHFSSPSLPPVLAFELRSSSTDHRWNVAWSGATSASQAIEVAQQFGGCISLPDRARVQVRAFSNVPKATLVTIEPSNEDDWEVRILHEKMRFPLWLNGRTTITFPSCFNLPLKSIYLWDITNATGGRDRSCSCSKETQDCQPTWNNVLITISSVRSCCAKVITKREHENSGNDGLKTRSSSTPRESNSGNDRKDNCEAIVKDNREAIVAQQFGDCISLLDSSRVQVRALLNVRILHEEMRFPFVVERPHYHYIPGCSNLPKESRGNKMFSLQSLEFVVVVPRLSPKESTKNSENDGLQTRSRSTPNESNGGSDRKDNREAIVGLLISDSVVKGHVMIQLYGIYSQFLDSKRSVATQVFLPLSL
ncbi:unnamed protein product [Malus baccata var. baccata]